VDDQHFDILTRAVGRRACTALGARVLATAFGVSVADIDAKTPQRQTKQPSVRRGHRCVPDAPYGKRTCRSLQCGCYRRDGAPASCVCRRSHQGCSYGPCTTTLDCCNGRCRTARPGAGPTCSDIECAAIGGACFGDTRCCDGGCGFVSSRGTCRSQSCRDTGGACTGITECCTGSCTAGVCVTS